MRLEHLHSYCVPCIQIVPLLIDRRRHSSILDIQSFKVAVCDTDHCLVVAKFQERLAVNEQELKRSRSQ
jgi:hypothetical protein